jgi:hypothetical protein
VGLSPAIVSNQEEVITDLAAKTRTKLLLASKLFSPFPSGLAANLGLGKQRNRKLD